MSHRKPDLQILKTALKAQISIFKSDPKVAADLKTLTLKAAAHLSHFPTKVRNS